MKPLALLLTTVPLALVTCRERRNGSPPADRNTTTTAMTAPATDHGLLAPPASGPGPVLGGCPLFPADNPWNQDISRLPVHPQSGRFIANIQAHGDPNLHPDFGSDRAYGIPYTVAPAGTPPVPIRYDEYGDESDPGPFPIPLDVAIEGGNDRHILVVQSGTCRLFELYHSRREGRGFVAGSGASWDLRSNALRPDTWTSCDQAGLPILPGLVRRDEVQAGAIRHALRVTFDHTQAGWIAPARHPGGDDSDPDAPPMGLRLRLRADYDLSRFHGATRVILEALKRYGMFTADTGTNWFITGAMDPGWDDDDLAQLRDVPGTAFEAVLTGPIQRRP
ncbi:MAG: hypothetical protein HY909_01820 [Deltaproteobacteria bacterium]|nr:hypothetical protein [Deltaproteobacteria bacterium]